MSTPRPSFSAARAREANRAAKAASRARAAEAGAPDPATLDRAIADGLAVVIAGAPKGYRLASPIDAGAVILAAAAALKARTKRGLAAGTNPVIYRREAVSAALAARLGLDP